MYYQCSDRRAFYEFLEISLRHKSEMVVYEAARAICTLEDVTPRELQPAISGTADWTLLS